MMNFRVILFLATLGHGLGGRFENGIAGGMDGCISNCLDGGQPRDFCERMCSDSRRRADLPFPFAPGFLCGNVLGGDVGDGCWMGCKCKAGLDCQIGIDGPGRAQTCYNLAKYSTRHYKPVKSKVGDACLSAARPNAVCEDGLSCTPLQRQTELSPKKYTWRERKCSRTLGKSCDSASDCDVGLSCLPRAPEHRNAINIRLGGAPFKFCTPDYSKAAWMDLKSRGQRCSEDDDCDGNLFCVKGYQFWTYRDGQPVLTHADSTCGECGKDGASKGCPLK